MINVLYIVFFPFLLVLSLGFVIICYVSILLLIIKDKLMAQRCKLLDILNIIKNILKSIGF